MISSSYEFALDPDTPTRTLLLAVDEEHTFHKWPKDGR